jgi:hypothetical protein
MAKEIMKCPFSNRICEECAIYRGRHYFLCYAEKYRGHIDTQNKNRTNKAFKINTKPEFDIPLVVPKGAIDPFSNNNLDSKHSVKKLKRRPISNASGR